MKRHNTFEAAYGPVKFSMIFLHVKVVYTDLELHWTHIINDALSTLKVKNIFPCISSFLVFSYYVMCLDFETFYPTNPQKPLWVKVYHEEINKLKPKKLPMNDIHLHEQFKKYFGYKKAIKCKVGTSTPLLFHLKEIYKLHAWYGWHLSHDLCLSCSSRSEVL